MASVTWLRSSTSGTRLALGFVGGVVATLIFHQLGLELLHALGMTPNTPYGRNPTWPLALPQYFSLSFWGGVWGIVFVLVEPYLARSPGGYWVGAILFGAIFPTLVAWFIVLPLKGLPVGGGFRFPGLLVGPIVNGLWGLGTGLFLHFVPGAGDRPA